MNREPSIVMHALADWIWRGPSSIASLPRQRKAPRAGKPWLDFRTRERHAVGSPERNMSTDNPLLSDA
ncbi:MAG TPA: hypothetical protein VFI81_00015, partial [Rhodanobacteraceae bacterium]|nr:hypothetical protein [Rhodanobacteraceae bacterium]